MRDRQAGSAVLELPLAVGLLLVPLALLVATLPSWPERQTVARAAAAEAARSLALARSWDEGAAQAGDAVTRAAANEGLDPSQVDLALSGTLERGSSVTASVTVRMPAVTVPGISTLGAWSWTASHTERVDDYRSVP